VQTTVLKLTNLPPRDAEVVTALHRVSCLHPSQDQDVAVAFTDYAGRVYRTAVINGAQQLAQSEHEVHALGLAALSQDVSADVVTFVTVR
jgi:hypothetical protein